MYNVGEMDIEELTWREQEVLGLLAERLTNREIAGQLHLAESTVKEYVSNILAKLYVKNRRQAVAEAKKLGLLAGRPQSTTESITNLPVYTSQIIGRVDELQKIKHLLQEGTRLLTLVGPGGIGKSRLAIQAAEQSASHFEYGCYFVSLAPIESSNQIIQAIAEALNFPLPTYEEAIKQLIRFLQKKQLLLVLDNFEHLLNNGSAIVEQILRSARGLKILVTSRERLSLPGEVSFQIGGLARPASLEEDDLTAYDAIALFIQCARGTQLSFSPSPSDLKKIAEICEIVQGMPLAIELAAAWLRILTIDEIKREIVQNFDILARDSRGANERHSSIRTVFEHSWSMLLPEEQELFMRVSVFRGGFTRTAAEKAAGATLLTLSRLVDKSVIKYDPETNRFQVHELLRQYGREQLEMLPDKHQSVQAQHATYFAIFMQANWERLKGKHQLAAIAEIDADLENVRKAWNHYVSHANAVQMRKFLNSFWLVHWIHGWNLSAVNLFNSAAEALSGLRDEISINVRALAMANQAFFLAWLGLAEEGYALANESIDSLRSSNDSLARYFAYHGLTLSAYYLEHFNEEKLANDQMRNIARSMGDEWLLAFAEFTSSVALFRSAEYEGSKHLAVSSLNRSIAIENLAVQALSLNALGHLYKVRGDHQQAKKHYLRSLQKACTLGFQWQIENATKYLGQLALKQNDLSEAEGYFLQSLNIANELGLEREIANHLFEFAKLRAAQDRVQEAVTILGMLLTLPVINQARLGGGRIKEYAQELLADLSDRLLPDAFQKSLDRGSQLDLQAFLISLIDSI